MNLNNELFKQTNLRLAKALSLALPSNQLNDISNIFLKITFTLNKKKTVHKKDKLVYLESFLLDLDSVLAKRWGL